MERSETAFFLGKAEEAESRAADALEGMERDTWLEIAREYRRLAELHPQPTKRLWDDPN
jgi:hypothetical protein